MKLFIVLTLALFAVASCDLTFLPKPEGVISDLEDHRPIDDLRYFFMTLYKQFNLTDPDFIIECFCDKTATLFFKSLYEFNQLLNDTKERNEFKLHFDYLKLAALLKSLEDTAKCVIKTRDWDDLLNALEVEERDPQILALVNYIYYQARYSALLNDFVPLIIGLENKNHRKAGIAYSRLISNMVETVKYRGLHFIANQAFSNGFAVRLHLPTPGDSVRCFDNESAAAYLEFFLKLSEEISNGKWKESPINTHFFWRDYGKKIMEKIPKEDWGCVVGSHDYEVFYDRFGIRMYDREFLDLLLKYVNNNRLHYWMMMKSMKESFDNYNLGHAGSVWGHLIKRIIRSRGEIDSEETEEPQDIEV